MKKLLAATLTTFAVFAVSTPAMADLKLATDKNCMTCHSIGKKVVGPSYKDIATKYKAQKDAVDMLAGKIQKGGAGVWGPIPMPANAQVNAAEAKALAIWVMSLSEYIEREQPKASRLEGESRGGVKDIYRFENGDLRVSCNNGSAEVIMKSDSGGWYFNRRNYKEISLLTSAACPL